MDLQHDGISPVRIHYLAFYSLISSKGRYRALYLLQNSFTDRSLAHYNGDFFSVVKKMSKVNVQRGHYAIWKSKDKLRITSQAICTTTFLARL
jgi:hypothetical protein